MPTYFQRPENALKRAHEFIDVGKKDRALEALYDVIKSKKHRTWQKIHEPIMLQYLDLCVELKKSHLAKEGLFQYRNICQQVNIKSLEDVVKAYLQLAENKTEAARQESQQAVIDIDDLDNIQTPESLLLSAVSGEDTQDRTDRVVLTPWVKFLWESYRQCLELLRNNSRVERLYHDIAHQAFKFCLKYSRKTEFRKLCDNLRAHLGHIHKHQNQQASINLNNVETQGMHLETRLCQLESAISMELWQEAYKAIEDIHGLMNLSKKPAKAQLMANYYQKLSLVFWKAGNNLFHASALFRLFHLSRELKKNLTQEEVQKMASRVLLATLSIPLVQVRSEFDRLLDLEDNYNEKQRRLATLLGLPNPPNRAALVKDLMRFNVLQYAMPQLQDLYRWLEMDFHPLQMCFKIQGALEFINSKESNAELQQYTPALQDIALNRLLKQVSEVYQTIQFSRLLELAPFASAFTLERVVVTAARNSDLQVRIDHRTQCLHFGTDLCYSAREEVTHSHYIQNMPSDQVRHQLIGMETAIAKSVHLIQPDKEKTEQAELRKTIVQVYEANWETEHQAILERRQIIEDLKEMMETLSIQRKEEERRAVEETRKAQQQQEEERLLREAEERDLKRRQNEAEEIKKKMLKDKLEQLRNTAVGAKFLQEIAEEDLEKLDTDELMQRHMDQLDREKREHTAKLKALEKKVDFVERAKRVEEIPLLQAQYEEMQKKNKEFWDEQEKERIKKLISERELAIDHRKRLQRMKEDRDIFLQQLKTARSSHFKQREVEFEERLERERQVRLVQRKQERRHERKMERRRQKEEEEQRKREEEQRKEEEKRRKIEEEEKKQRAAEQEEKDRQYREQKKKLDEQAEKMRQKELEVEERLKRQKEAEMAGRERDSKPAPTSSTPSAAPASEQGSWRRKDDDSKPSPATTPSDGPEGKTNAPWRPNNQESKWRTKERQRTDSWAPKDREKEGEPAPYQRRGNEDGGDNWRSSRDDKGGSSWRSGGGAPRDSDRPRDLDRPRDFERPPRDFGDRERPPRDFGDRERPPRDFGGREEGGSRDWRSKDESRPAFDDPRDDRGGPRRVGGSRDERGGGGRSYRDDEDRGGGRRGGFRDDRPPPSRDTNDWRTRDEERRGGFRDRDDRPRDRDDRPRDRDDRPPRETNDWRSGPPKDFSRGGGRDDDDRGERRGPREDRPPREDRGPRGEDRGPRDEESKGGRARAEPRKPPKVEPDADGWTSVPTRR